MAGPAFIETTIEYRFQNGIQVVGTFAQTGDQTITGALTVTNGVTVSAGGLNITAGALNHDGTTVGLYGATPVTQAAVPTAMHAAVTQAGSDTGDTAIQALTSTSPFGFVNAAEGEAIVAMVINNNAVLTELRTALINIGIMAAS